MGGSAIWLLTIFLGILNIEVSIQATTSKIVLSLPVTTEFFPINEIKTTVDPEKTTSKDKLVDYVKSFTNVKDLLMQEIHTLDKDSSDAKTQEEVAETFKAEAQRDRANLQTTARPSNSTIEKEDTAANEGEELKKYDDASYDDDDASDEENEDDDDYDDDDDEDDELDELDEEVMTQCPDYCKCAGQYAAAMTATCTKLLDEQSFGPGISHLRIENAGEIRLGPNALRVRGLQQLESITISDTHILELDRTAFNGIPYLFAVNLTRNGLQDIHPTTFQNNTQLSLLTIADNPLKHMQDSRSTKYYLLHAPSVTDFDFSNNGILRLKRTSFSRMTGLNYINLRNNRLREIDSSTFNSLESLVEVDMSNNMLFDLPIDLFDDKNVQQLRIAGNNLMTLSVVSASKLTTLDASRNKIKVIAKEDLNNVPLLEQLYLKSNNLKRIHQHAFSHLDQLTYVDISDNKLSLLTEHHFRTNARLQVLLMNDNPALQSLPVFKIMGMEYDTFSVFRFECANCGLESLKPGTFDEMPAITRLNLARNRLTTLPDGLLENLSSLRELDLSDNIISALDYGMFRGAQSLNKLNLARNPLRTLQVAPLLAMPGLVKLDVSRCNLERIWSEARVPLMPLRFLTVRGNLLRRITVEELNAMPKLSALDLSHNPLNCDTEFNEALQWLTDRGVMPTETHKSAIDFNNIDDSSISTGISQWTDLAKIICNGIKDGPPSRSFPGKNAQSPKEVFLGFDEPEDFDTILRNEISKAEEMLKMDIDHGLRPIDDPRLLENEDYDNNFVNTAEYHWYEMKSGYKIWLISGSILFVLIVCVIVARIACCLANKRGRGPVLRPPMILRQGLIDNKNCGLVYKPLQEEIATPQMKRNTFYSSSTFHYDKIVPESV